MDDVLRLLVRGSANRHTGETSLNKESSRSHMVFTCVVESKTAEDGASTIRRSQLNLVDLAGQWGGGEAVLREAAGIGTGSRLYYKHLVLVPWNLGCTGRRRA